MRRPGRFTCTRRSQTGIGTAGDRLPTAIYDAYEFEGALGFPILPDVFNDTLSGRIAFSVGFRDGYLNNTCADWDPTAHVNPETGQPYVEVSQERTEAIYSQLDPSLGPVDVEDTNIDSYLYFNNDLYTDLLERGAVPFSPTRRYIDPMTGEEKLGRIQNVQFFMSTDEVCVLAPPGNVVTPKGAAAPNATEPAGTYRGSRPVPLTLEDFQGLKSKLNNVKYWATRGMLRFQPNDSLDFLFIAHWGQNRGDSFHLQTVGARTTSRPRSTR